MAGQARQTELDFEAAWVVVGRGAYAFDREERDRLRCDLALQIARLVASGVNDNRELVRRFHPPVPALSRPATHSEIERGSSPASLAAERQGLARGKPNKTSL